jgi:hypothetical protein
MHRRTVHRWMTALALVAALALAGARPAAAADTDFLDRLASLWSAVTGGEPAGLWETVIGWFGGTAKTSSSDEGDRGAGYDPNGVTAPSSSQPTDGSN